MNNDVIRIHIDRLVVHGIDPSGIDPGDLHGMIERAVARDLASLELPSGRRVTANERVDLTALPNDTRGLADAIARGVAGSVNGGGRHG